MSEGRLGVGRRAGAEPPGVAQRPTGARWHGRSRAATVVFTERAPARSACADPEEASVALIASARRSLAAMLPFAAELLLADHRRGGPKRLLSAICTLVDLPDLVEGPVGELDTLVADRHLIHAL